MKAIHFILIGIATLLLIIGLSFAFGWTNVFYTKTVGKAQENANRTVFEQTQSYVEGKRQELAKFHHEWVQSDDLGKKSIESVIRQSFANFDQSKITDPDLYDFLHKIMNN